MPLEYDAKFRWKALIPVLNEHTMWFHDVLPQVFYPDLVHTNNIMAKPVSFARWLVQAHSDNGIAPEVVEKLSKLHSDLFTASDKLIAESKSGVVKPEYKTFQDFMTVYEEFMFCVRRLENDFMVEESGYDTFTGLRSKNLLKADIERELQRLSRQGRSFCLAVTRIDHFDELEKNYDRGEVNAYIKLVSDLIKLSIRSYDDAYHIGGNEFVLCLKQADMTGGISALDRLRRELERQKITISYTGVPNLLSMSCCIAEPVDGDNVDDLLKNLRKDLEKTGKGGDSVFSYYEMSPLQRYVQESGRA